MSKVFSIIINTADIFSRKNLLFGNLKHLIDSSIIKVKLDFYDESRLAEFKK